MAKFTLQAAELCFIQYVCRECYDIWTANAESGQPPAAIPIDEIERKLDADFFAGRWSRATDRQRGLLWVIATLPSCPAEFTVQEIVTHSPDVLDKGFSASHANQMLDTLTDRGLVYKNRRGKYLLAVPLLERYIQRVWERRLVIEDGEE